MNETNPACPCKHKGCKRLGSCDECRKRHEHKKHPVYYERKPKKPQTPK